MKPRFLARGLAVALVLMSGTAAAGGGDEDAERLFREGQKLMEERRFGEACPKFEQAYAKDRQLGTLINLAFCHKEQGAVWYAWLEFREAEVKASDRPDRRDFAKQRLAELEKLLPKLIIDNPRGLPLTDVIVEDRKVWNAEKHGELFAAEVGQRKFIFKAKGKKPVSALISVNAKSDKVQRVAVPEMEDGGEDAPAVVDRPLPEVPKGDATPPPAADSSPGGAQRTIGWVAVGVGGVAVVIGVVEGALTIFSPCAGATSCLKEQRDSANKSGTISTIAWIVGGVGVIGGAALVLTAPSGPKGATSDRGNVRPRSSGVAVTPRIGLGWAGLDGTF